MFSIVFSLFGFANLAFTLPNQAKAWAAMKKVFEILDTRVKNDSRGKDGR